MNGMKFCQIDSFTDKPYLGNPAGVVPGADALTDKEMQMIAREVNLSETAFILKPDVEEADVRLRWFTPAVEVPFCGHATVAAFHYMGWEGMFDLPDDGVKTLTLQCRLGMLPIELISSSGSLDMVMISVPAPEFIQLDPEEKKKILSALGAEEAYDNNLPILNSDQGQTFVPLKTLKQLNSLDLDMNRLDTIARELNINFCVFTTETMNPTAAVHIRFFAPALGIPEDPVTGAANAPLGAYLYENGLLREGESSYTAEQGYAMGRDGTVFCEVILMDGKPSAVKVGGKAVKVIEGMLRKP